jgi:RNA polymerase sigma-70 factor (ECF subfamily)
MPEVGDRQAALAALHVEDLYIACACARAVPRALFEFERRFFPDVSACLGSMGLRAALCDEVKQILREKLFVERGGPAKIVDYSGVGPLASWLRVAAIRTALSLLRKELKEAPAETEAQLEMEAPAPDPELEYLKVRYQREFAESFQEAFAELPRKERNLMRLHFVDGLNIDEIGVFFRVHRSTVARWIVRCREDLQARVRKGLAARLSLSRSEVESLIGLVQSQLEVSLRTVLGASGTTTA